MKLAETKYDNSETGCCARLDAARWDEKEFTWTGRRFMRDRIHSILHVPIDFGRVIRRDQEALESAEAYAEEPIWLSDHLSPWKSDIYHAVDRDVPGMTMEKLSGTFLTKVFEGPYRDAPRWAERMHEYAKSKGHEVRKLYTFYATCPKCAKQFGKNQVVLFAKVA